MGTAIPTDRALQLLRALQPASDDLRAQLVLLRTRVRRRDVRGAEELLDSLIVLATSNGHAPTLKLPPLRKPANASCPFGWKYSTKGKRQRDRRHVCGPECSWSSEEALSWNPPYRVRPGVEITSRLVPVPPCANCERKRGEHWTLKSDADGRLLGFAPIPDCTYTPEGEQP